jgi:hypothetical protein
VSAIGEWGESLPSAPIITYVESPSNVNLRWNVVPGAYGYNIYRNATASGDGGAVYLLAETVTRTHVDNGGTVDTTIAPLPAGSLSLFSAESDLITPREGGAGTALAITGTKVRQFVYIFGGRSTSAAVTTYLSDGEVAEVLSDGSLSPFGLLGESMTSPRAFFRLVSNLGQDGFIGPSSDPGEGPLETGGEVGDLMLIAVQGDDIYDEGTNTNAGLMSTEITRIQKENGSITEWTAQDFLLTGKAAHGMGAELFFDHLFIFSGVNGETLADGPDPDNAAPKRLFFDEDGTDDTAIIDDLQASGSKFVVLRSYYGMVRLNGYIYALGGHDNGTGPLASVERCLQ